MRPRCARRSDPPRSTSRWRPSRDSPQRHAGRRRTRRCRPRRRWRTRVRSSPTRRAPACGLVLSLPRSRPLPRARAGARPRPVRCRRRPRAQWPRARPSEPLSCDSSVSVSRLDTQGRWCRVTSVGDQLARLLAATRPTAVNLRWALDRMARVAAETPESWGGSGVWERLQAEATAIWEEDRAMCRRIGEAGLPLIPDGAKVLTHCNAGALATGGIGTALAPLYLAHEAGRRLHVFVDETRPVLQGARLTAWELGHAGVPCTVIADAVAGSLMRQAQVDLVIVGADRIAANGDFANKIGTYPLAVLALHHGVPFYCAGPSPTIDGAPADA